MDWTVLGKIVILYGTVLVIMKFMGKREIGQLSLFDFVVILVIADIGVAGIDSQEINFYIFILGIVLIALIQKLLAIILLRIPVLRNWIDGDESIVIIDGKINLKEMRKQAYNIDDLIIQMRIKNVRSLSEIRYAILEANGELSIFKFSDFEPDSNTAEETGANTMTKTITPKTNNKTGEVVSDSSSKKKQSPNQNNIYPFPLIVSGKVNKKNMRLLNKSDEWLQKEIKKQGYKDVKEVYYANFENGKLFIVQTCDF